MSVPDRPWIADREQLVRSGLEFAYARLLGECGHATAKIAHVPDCPG
jgi:hypothetical protein